MDQDLGLFGPILGVIGPFWTYFRGSEPFSGLFWGLWGHLGPISEVLEHYLGRLGPISGILGPFWTYFGGYGPLFGPF